MQAARLSSKAYVYDDVTYVYDDVTYVQAWLASQQHQLAVFKEAQVPCSLSLSLSLTHTHNLFSLPPASGLYIGE